MNWETYPEYITPKDDYGGQDCDTLMFLWNLKERPGAKVIEAGANEEASCRLLADSGYKVVGVDLRRQEWKLPHNYVRIEGDFVSIAPLLTPDFDAAFSTSALEHFGLPMYSFHTFVEDYDCQAVDQMYDLLKPGGRAYITVPYGKEFRRDRDWRVYCKKTIQERMVRKFTVEDMLFFKSGDCSCPETGMHRMVAEKDADEYSGDPPHATVLLVLRK